MNATVNVANLTVMPGYRPIAQLYADSRSAAVRAAPEKHLQPGSSKLLLVSKPARYGQISQYYRQNSGLNYKTLRLPLGLSGG
ncbi:hypothetical protein IQ270_08025 [Microcoleus sp. LEGE 07076]|uniref:hypothetical protein n=1 Tax=Microcoleus sp. LEGE 07076 TaxID=915322 RepID=UPI00187FF8E7|nr:hypothetical protein [Microcoleus sp. LEGE 07076]MBE9184669.1 hypothetical protein [Microcoleus sp. LEGE 07076]